jgi:hypothetical protein
VSFKGDYTKFAKEKLAKELKIRIIFMELADAV